MINIDQMINSSKNVNYNKRRVLFIVGICLLIVLSSSIFAGYTRALPSYTQSYGYSIYSGTQVSREACTEGQDFVIQVQPFGCTPAVVRSDLLEEQDYPVFCQLLATKLNPLIDVEAIQYITFKGKLPDGVRAVNFFPSRAALGYVGNLGLGYNEVLNRPVLNNIGYAIILLERNKNESSMPDFVGGNMTAELRYNVKNAFGIGQVNFYLPETSNNEWENSKKQYSFWKGKGYVRAESVENDRATIGIYSNNQRVSSFTLTKGQTSGMYYLLGFQCLAGLQVRLDNLAVPDTRARLEINGEVVEVIENEKFLDDQCIARKVDRKGVVQSVTIKCPDEDAFSLRIVPKLTLSVNGEEKIAEIGDWLYFSGEKNIYLGYAGTTGNTGNKEDLFVYYFAIPTKQEKLTDTELTEVENMAEGMESCSRIYGNQATNKAACLAKRYTSFFKRYLVDAPIQGQDYKRAKYGESVEFIDGTVKVIDFAEGANAFINGTIKTNYDKAMQDYDAILNSYADTSYKPEYEGVTKGEEALFEKIFLTSKTMQKLSMVEFCEEFKEKYPESKLIDSLKQFCDNPLEISSGAITTQSVSIQGRVKEITFEGIKEPTFDEYGVEVFVQGPNEFSETISLRKEQLVYLDEFRTDEELDGAAEREYIQLVYVDVGEAKLDTRINRADPNIIKDIAKGVARFFFKSDTVPLKENVPQGVEGGYTFTLKKVNVKKEAKITIIPKINYERSNASFSFKIGIEKRSLKLSPQKTQERVNALNERIAEWEERVDKLGKVVSGMKAVCLGTGTYLTVKNFVQNMGGKAIARQQVMRAKGGWYEQCTDLVNKKQYKDVDECLLDNSKKINDDVNAYYESLQDQNEELDSLQDSYEKTSFLGEKVVDTEDYKQAYISEGYKAELKRNLHQKFGNNVTINNEVIDVDTFVDNLNPNSASVSDFREMELLSRVEGSESLDKMTEGGLKDVINSIHESNKESVERSTFAKEVGVEEVHVGYDKDIQTFAITSDKTYSQVRNNFGVVYVNSTNSDELGSLSEIREDALVEFYKDPVTGRKYLLELNGDYDVTKTYTIQNNGNLILENPSIENPLKLDFKKYDAEAYTNPYKGSLGDGRPLVRYYETEPYVGLPAIVPFDLEKGWYAATKQTLPIFGSVRSFDDSGRVTSFYVCNVGENGYEENVGGDDICELINTGTGQPYDQFPWLTSDESVKIIKCAESAIAQASRLYPAKGKIAINTLCSKRGKIDVEVGSPAVDIPDIKCQDVYSPAECKILFNVCDPVICPSSRCDLGGAYPVKDVIQSGIIGSVVLCLPNFPEVYVPICLSGIHAGMDGWVSVMENHRDCLQHSLDTGETIGICDEIYSVYACEMFWKEGINVAKYAVPKLLEIAQGQNSRGGGEYLGVQTAWDSAGKSVDYFTQYYATNSFDAFKARSTQDIGTGVCKVYASGSFPIGGGALDALLEPDSPSQFTGNFEEIPFTTATNPPISQYKVFYHIYAGNDQGAYYRIYLKSGPGGSYYEDTNSIRTVDSGFIPAGDYASKTVDFTAISGYQQLCIVVNNQEECGFKQASTDFAVNYISEKYIEEQAKASDITSTKECVAGSASLYSLINPNIEAGASELASPAIYNRGLTRICASECPGQNVGECKSDKPMWIDVGYCDDRNMRCWLSKENIQDIIKNTNIEESILSEQTDRLMELLRNGTDYYSDDNEFEDALGEFNKAERPSAGDWITVSPRITILNQILEKSLFGYQKAHAHLLRGKEYGWMSSTEYLFKYSGPPDAEPNKEASTIKGTSLSAINLQTFDLTLGGNVTFITNSKSHVLFLDTISFEGLASFTIQPDGVTFMKGEGDSVTLDLDGFYGRSFYMEVISVAPNSVKIGLKEIDKKKPNSIQFMRDQLEDYGIDTSLMSDQEVVDAYNQYKIDTGIVDRVQSPIFEFEDGSNLQNLIYNYSRGDWYWSLDGGNRWNNVNDAEAIKDKKLSEGEKNVNFIKRLDEQDYLTGLGYLLQRTMDNKEGGEWWKYPKLWDADLVTQYVNFDNKGVFTVTIGDDDERTYFRYGYFEDLKTEEWQVRTPGEDWRNTASPKLTGQPLALYEAIRGRGFVEGAKIIFDLGVVPITDQPSFKSRDAEEIYLSINHLVGTTINANCLKYVQEFVDAANPRGIDPLLLMALAQVESSCNPSASSESTNYPFERGASYGLMQISGRSWCGKHGLSSDREECISQLRDPLLNSNVGAEILKKNYNDGPINYTCNAFENQPAVDKKYKGWEAALRRYNGKGCASAEFQADQIFVEKVMAVYNNLSANSYVPGVGSGTSGTSIGGIAGYDTNEMITGKYAMLMRSDEVFYCDYQKKGMTLNTYDGKPDQVIEANLDINTCKNMRAELMDLKLNNCKAADYRFQRFSFSTNENKCHRVASTEKGGVKMCYVDYTLANECTVCDASKDCSVYEKEEDECNLDPCVYGCKWSSSLKSCVSDDLIVGKFMLMQNLNNDVFECEKQAKGMSINGEVIATDLSLEECRNLRKENLKSVGDCEASEGLVNVFGVDVDECHKTTQSDVMCYVSYERANDCEACDYSKSCSTYDNQAECEVDACVKGCSWDATQVKCIDPLLGSDTPDDTFSREEIGADEITNLDKIPGLVKEIYESGVTYVNIEELDYGYNVEVIKDWVVDQKIWIVIDKTGKIIDYNVGFLTFGENPEEDSEIKKILGFVKQADNIGIKSLKIEKIPGGYRVTVEKWLINIYGVGMDADIVAIINDDGKTIKVDMNPALKWYLELRGQDFWDTTSIATSGQVTEIKTSDFTPEEKARFDSFIIEYQEAGKDPAFYVYSNNQWYGGRSKEGTFSKVFEDKDYKEGILFLIENTDKDANSQLVSKSFVYQNKVFSMNIFSQDVYFKYGSDGITISYKWSYSLDNRDWRTTIAPGTSPEVFAVFNSLQKKPEFVDGVIYLISLDNGIQAEDLDVGAIPKDTVISPGVEITLGTIPDEEKAELEDIPGYVLEISKLGIESGEIKKLDIGYEFKFEKDIFLFGSSEFTFIIDDSGNVIDKDTPWGYTLNPFAGKIEDSPDFKKVISFLRKAQSLDIRSFKLEKLENGYKIILSKNIINMFGKEINSEMIIITDKDGRIINTDMPWYLEWLNSASDLFN